MVELFQPDANGGTTIHYACGTGEIEMLSYISSYATAYELDQKDLSGLGPVVHAINNSHLLPMIYLLFEKEVNTELLDYNKCSIVHWAAYQQNINILKILDHMGLVDKFLEEKDTQN